MTLAIIGIVAFLVLILLGMNIGVSLLLVGTIGYALAVTPGAALGLLRSIPASQAASYALMVIPMFVIMGNFAFVAGLSEGLYRFCEKWLSRLPGNLACATVVSATGFHVICGSIAATTATMGTIAIPEMRKYGYNDGFATGSVAIGGALGNLIPPSTMLIIYGVVAEESIGRLFAAGIFPAIVLLILCVLTIVLIVKIKPSLAPPPHKTPWIERIKSLPAIIPIIIVFGVVLGGMFSGLFTVNQAAALGALVTMIITLVKKAFTWKNFKKVMANSVQTTAMTFLIIIGAAVFCTFLNITGFPEMLAGMIKGLDVSKYVVLLLMTLIYLILGAIMDELPMMMMTVPIFLPIVTELGFSPVWFGVYVVLCMEMGAIAPPVGLACFILAGIAKDVPLGTIYKGALPYLLTIIITIIIIMFLPDLATYLPNLLYGN
jgi:tripartite ATP-independent transporter DctM subunit